MSSPEISILLPVHNVEIYISDAVNSILNQTFENYELIIIDDSDDKTSDIIKSFNDKRIKYFYREPVGLANQLNFGLEKCTAKYIARMDGDDISHKDRLSKQMRFLEKNKEIDIVGTNFYYIKNDNSILSEKSLPESHNEIEYMMPIEASILHPTIMARKKVFELAGKYSGDYLIEDVELFLRFLNIGFKFYNIQDFLFFYRYEKKSIGKLKIQKANRIELGYNYLNKLKNEENYLRFAFLEYYNGDMKLARKYFLKFISKYPLKSIKVFRYIIITFLGNNIVNWLRDYYILAKINKVFIKFFHFDTNKIKKL